jgi:SWI/SNF-related matrix-associated actin-dependent regulator 1 of chromatin subfamily A
MLYTVGHTALSYDEWVRRYCDGYWAQGRFRITGTTKQRIPELREILKTSGFIKRRRREEVLPDLPTVTLQTLTLPPGNPTDEPEEIREVLERERARVAEALEAGGEVDLDGLAPSVPTIRRWNALRKLKPVGDLLDDELARREYGKVVVFGCHRALVDGLASRLVRYNPAVICGSTPTAKRGEEVERFQRDPACRVFVGNILAAGIGITLVAAHHVVLAEQDWVPANNDQALSRVVRIGQSRGVLVRIIELDDSLDQKISAILTRKLRQISEVWKNNN